MRAGCEPSYRSLSGGRGPALPPAALLDVPDFTAWVGAVLLDTEAFDGEALMETLVDVQLLEVVGTYTTGQLRFRFHHLLRLFGRERVGQEESVADRENTADRALRAWLAIAHRAHAREYGGDFARVRGTTEGRSPGPDLLAEPNRPLTGLVPGRAAMPDSVGRLGCAAQTGGTDHAEEMPRV